MDKFWEHVQQLGPSRFKCNYCELDYSGSVTRVKAHLACLTGHDFQICTKVPDHVQVEASAEMNLSASKKKRMNETLKSGIGSTNSHGRSIHQTTMVELIAQQDKKSLENMIGEFFVKNNISFNVIQTESFIQMMKGACAYGQGFVIPSCSTLRTRLIPEAKVEIMEYVSNIKSTWGGTGYTIMSDSWIDLKKRSWVNVIAYSPGGAVFLKYNDANYNCYGDMLIEKWSHMHRTNYAAHGINLLLKDIHKHVRWVREIIDDGKHVVDYMHRHTVVIALMREFTNDKEIKQPCKTRFATNFLKLQSLIVVENKLRLLVALSEWRGFYCNRVEITLKTVRIIQSDIFWDEAKEVIAFIDPLIRILRLVDSDGSTACYLYEATVRAKEKLRKLKESDGVKYFTILDLFDTMVEKNIIHLVHVLAAALNPNNLFDGGLFIETNLVRIYGWLSSCGSKGCLQNLKLTLQFLSLREELECLGRKDAAQTKKRNRLTPEMLEDLVYIRMNSLIKEKYESRAIYDTKPIDLKKLGDLPDVNIDLETERLEETYVEPIHDQTNSIL
ncbi:uncharacterized protein LOC122086211 [Macadamia integrifolia]|uniref:uncharacterized protein LOC122086211 n=1 Tax=Macadamia integrifolia TaxID=60698 RepID=UPI001C4E63D0|nr:uncharacterized protein LOC122086211 [Macadamia integrifolia]